MRLITSLISYVVILLMTFGTIFAQTEATVTLPDLAVAPGASINVPITVTTAYSIGAAQFVVQYNSDVLSFVSAQVGAGAPGFSVSNINTDLPFQATAPGTDENALVQISGGATNSFTGNNREVVVLNFEVIGSSNDSSPLVFDEGATRTYLSTVDFQDISGNDINFVNGSVSSIVPVELSSFNAYVEQGQIILEWNTESETDNFGFEIQRKNNDDIFNKVGFVPGHGTTLAQNNYQFIDSNLSNGTYYYRLKQIDHDGSYQFSETKTVTILASLKYNLFQNYPNPFNPETVIKFEIPEASHVNLVIYNSLGEEIKKLINEKKNDGIYEIKWDGKNKDGVVMPSGVYLYLLSTGEHREVRKMILTK